MGSAGIFLDCVTQSHLAGRSGLIDREPLAVDGGGVGIDGSIALGHGTHVDIEAEQYPRGVGGRGSLSEPRGKPNYDNNGCENPGYHLPPPSNFAVLQPRPRCRGMARDRASIPAAAAASVGTGGPRMVSHNSSISAAFSELSRYTINGIFSDGSEL